MHENQNTANQEESTLLYLQQTYQGKIVEGSHSAAGNWLSFTLEDIRKGSAEISLTVREEMTNPYKNLHGGMMAVIMDEAIGWAVISLGMSRHYTSLNLNVDFLYAIPQGERLVAKSEVIRAGKKIVHVFCSVYDSAGRTLGRAASNLVVTSMPLELK